MFLLTSETSIIEINDNSFGVFEINLYFCPRLLKFCVDLAPQTRSVTPYCQDSLRRAKDGDASDGRAN